MALVSVPPILFSLGGEGVCLDNIFQKNYGVKTDIFWQNIAQTRIGKKTNPKRNIQKNVFISPALSQLYLVRRHM